jgi:hypothetical protein
MKWENSLWNYHKLGLIVAFFVFLLVSPPIYNFISKYNYNNWMVSITIGILTWGFVFLILHGYTNKPDDNEVIIDT